MGLAGARKRQKISHDPNNTAWTRNTTSYGQRILTASGWTAGSTLGAQDAAHSEHYTAGSAGHVRIALREDNLGLGASLKGENDAKNVQRMGALNDVLSRLNGDGDSEMEQKKKQAREDLTRRLYVEGKFGAMRFVRAGYLVGSEIVEKVPEVPKQKSSESIGADGSGPTKHMVLDEKAEKRKRKEAKRLRKEQKKQQEAAVEDDSRPQIDELTKKQSSGKKKRKREVGEGDLTQHPPSEAEAVAESGREAKKRQKLEKRARKEAKRKAKEDRHPNSKGTAESMDDKPDVNHTEATSASGAAAAAPPRQAVSGGRGIQAVRRRYIQQKGMAGINTDALREILMVKAA